MLIEARGSPGFRDMGSRVSGKGPFGDYACGKPGLSRTSS
jgi:hypothetical protein